MKKIYIIEMNERNQESMTRRKHNIIKHDTGVCVTWTNGDGRMG